MKASRCKELRPTQIDSWTVSQWHIQCESTNYIGGRELLPTLNCLSRNSIRIAKNFLATNNKMATLHLVVTKPLSKLRNLKDHEEDLAVIGFE